MELLMRERHRYPAERFLSADPAGLANRRRRARTLTSAAARERDGERRDGSRGETSPEPSLRRLGC